MTLWSSMVHICYHVGHEELASNYVALNHYRDTVLVVFNPSEYKNYLDDLGLLYDHTEVNFDKIMIVQLDSLEDGIELLEMVDPATGPICCLWHQGTRIADNIEENVKATN